MKPTSFGHFPSENQSLFTGVEPEKISENQEVFMKTGLTKKQKTTNIYFNENDPIIEVCTYNTSLKNRLTKFAEQYPAECRLLDDDGLGCMTFEVSKGRFGFRLTAPYSDERRVVARRFSNINNLQNHR